jgi:AcrR family transcriptional regulator
MSQRRYVQKARAEAAAETRARILDATLASFRRAPEDGLSVDQIAEEAGVARSTVYVVFGGRAGLFEAATLELVERAGRERLSKETMRPDALDALRGALRVSCEMYGAERDAFRAIISLGVTDPDAARAYELLEETRAGGMLFMAKRLHEEGKLRDGVTRRDAADVLWLLASFDAFDQLRTGRNLSTKKAADRIVEMAERTLCPS